MGKVILITGASSGIGFDAAKMLAVKGNKVYAAARRVERMEPLREYGVVPVRLDVTDEESARSCVETVLSDEGRIDVLINNAGFGYMGAVETVSLEEARKQMEVNVFGLARLCSLVIPHMREAGRGRIINTSSIAGKLVLQFGGWYNVSKYSVEALSDALRMELRPFGISVVKVQPGGIKTEWGVIAAKHIEETSSGTPYEHAGAKEARLMRMAYGDLPFFSKRKASDRAAIAGNEAAKGASDRDSEAAKGASDRDSEAASFQILSKPSVVARAICRASLSRCPRAVYRVGRGAWLMTGLHAILPPRLWDAIMRMI